MGQDKKSTVTGVLGNFKVDIKLTDELKMSTSMDKLLTAFDKITGMGIETIFNELIDNAIIPRIQDLFTSQLIPNIVSAFGNLSPLSVTLGGMAIVAGVSLAIHGLEEAWWDEYNKLFEENDVALYGDSVSNLVQKMNEFCAAQSLASSERMDYVSKAADEIPLIQTLADKYFDLSEKTDLSEKEYAELRLASEKLVENFPELERYYDETTGRINLERDAVNKLIDAKKQELILNAVSEKWSEALAAKIEQEMELEKAIKDVELAERRYGDIALDIAYKQAQYGQDVNLSDLQEAYADAALEVENLRNNLEKVKSTISDVDAEIEYYERIYAENYISAEDSKASATATVSEYNDTILENKESTYAAYGEWMETSNAILNDPEEENNPIAAAGESGTETVVAFNESIQDGIEDTTKVLTVFRSSIRNSLLPLKEMLFGIGQMAMVGLINGLNSKEQELQDKSKEIAENLSNTLKAGLEINSPSKVMFRLGAFTIEGFKDGMESMFDSVYSSVQGFSESIVGSSSLIADCSVGFNTLDTVAYVEQGTNENAATNMLVPYLAQIAQNTRESASKDFSVNIGDRDIARANIRGQKALGRRIVAGL